MQYLKKIKSVLINDKSKHNENIFMKKMWNR